MSIRRVFLASLLSVSLVIGFSEIMGCGSSDSGNDQPETYSVQAAAVPAFFGYSNDYKRYFTQDASGSGFIGDELSGGHWNDTYASMTRFNVGDGQYILGHRQSGYWFIQVLLPTGDLGPETDNGHWHDFYETLSSFQVGGRTFIFGHKRDNRRWFIQEISPSGKLHSGETANGHWDDFYETLVPFQVGGRTFLFGHKRDRRWFIQELLPGGKLHPHEADSGHWKHFYETLSSFQVGGRTFLFGHKRDDCRWFTQELLPGGKLHPHEADSGHWNHFYETLVPFQAGGRAFIFGHKPGDYRWFTQEISPNGTLHPHETDSGNWSHFYGHIFPFSFDGSYLHVADWMSRNSSFLSDKTLGQIIIPGSHDAGMHETRDCTFGASDCNTRTQVKSIHDQLQAGSRYFDLRTVYYKSEYHTGHYQDVPHLGILGCNGEKLADVLKGMKSFLDKNPGELVVLKFSHYYDRDEKKFSFTDKQKADLVKEVQSILGYYLVKRAPEDRLLGLTFGEIMSSGNVIGLFDHIASDKANGIFSSDDLHIYDEYSGTNDLHKMSADQINKLLNREQTDPGKQEDNHKNKLFLLSWTLTQDNTQAALCSVDVAKGIEDLAGKANTALIPTVYGHVLSGQIGKTLLPNILFVDFNGSFATRFAVLLNRNY